MNSLVSSKPNQYTGADMTRLLDLAVDAHGGIDQWDKHKALIADISISGAIWDYKHNPNLLNRTTIEAQLNEQRVVLNPFSGPEIRSVFVPGRVTLERSDNSIVVSRDNPRNSFSGQSADSAWDNLHVAYFSSYALWTYLLTPFLYTYHGFVTKEIAPWEENGEIWRRLKVTFPPGYESHTKEQVTYFGSDGLVRRHDYTVDILGGATGANYAFDYEIFSGIKIPTTRRVYAYDSDGYRIRDPLLVAIDIHSVKFLEAVD